MVAQMEEDTRKAVDTSSSRFERTKAIVIASAKEFGEDNAGRQAAALAYYTLFSLVPLLFVAVAVSTIALGPTERELPENCDRVTEQELGDEPLDRVVAEARRVAGTAVADPIRVILCGARKSAGASLSIGLALAAFSASGIFLQAQGVLNGIFGAAEKRTSGVMGFLRQRSIALVSAVILAILVLVPVLAVGLIQFARDLMPVHLDWVTPVLGLAVPLVSLAMLIGVVAGTFQVLTAVTIPAKAARRGSTATAVLGLFAAFLVGTYLGRGAPSGTLGVLGGLAVLLLFFNLMWNVYLFGAEITKTYSDYLEHGDVVQVSQRTSDTPRESPAPPSGSMSGPPEKMGFGPAVAMVIGMIIGRLGGKSR